MKREGVCLVSVLSPIIAPCTWDFLSAKMGIMTGVDFLLGANLVGKGPSPRRLMVHLAW